MTVTEAYKIQVNVTGLMRLSVQNVEQILYGRFSLEELVWKEHAVSGHYWPAFKTYWV